MKRLIFAAVLLAGQAAADIPQPQQLSDTVEVLTEALSLHGPVTPGDTFDTLNWQREDGSTTTIGVMNLHQNLVAAPDDAERQLVLDDFVDAMRRLDEDIAVSADNLYAVLRHEDYLKLDIKPVYRDFPGELAEMMVFDADNRVMLVMPDHLETLGLSADAAFDRARENLGEMAREASIEGNGLYMLTLPDPSYVGSIMLVDGLWEGVAAQLPGLTASVPARDLLVVFDGDDAEAVRLVQETNADMWPTLSYALTPALYRWTDSGWQLAE